MPSRVLDVGDSEDSNIVRLIVSTGLRGSYATLSYCWGGKHTGTTTKATIAAHLKGINLKELPTTFQDAIRVTRRLRTRFLWIDALCIIQDDLNDWQQESAQMSTIFSHAYVTLAATSASDCQGGLLLPFVPALHGTGEKSNDKFGLRLGHVHSRSPEFPLHTRGLDITGGQPITTHHQFDSSSSRLAMCLGHMV